MQIALCCFKTLFPLCYFLSSLTYILLQPGTGLAITPYPTYGTAAAHRTPQRELRQSYRWDAHLQKSLQQVLITGMLQHTPPVTRVLVTSGHERSVHRPSIHCGGHASEEKG